MAVVHGMLTTRGLNAIDGDLVLDRSFFAPIAHDRLRSTESRSSPTTSAPTPPRQFQIDADRLAPNPAGITEVIATPTLANVVLGPPPRLAAGDCGDWRGSVGATFADRGGSAEATFAGSYAASCGEREWWVSLLDPTAYVYSMFATYYREAGGRFLGGWRNGLAPKGKTPFATLESPPLYIVVRDVNTISNNVMARQVFLTLATAHDAARRRPRARTRWCGMARLAKLKMPELVLDNGSGLSRHERISAGSLVRLLLAADASPVREEFASSLAVAAMDGTV
jgi:D-alanyl-D-alanine carboxypeptidase/D-alanyl-D-alanine-endopeptidase (penicillin-binding protein 4)